EQAKLLASQPSTERDKKLAGISGKISEDQSNLADAERRNYWTWKLKRFVDIYCPTDPFQMLIIILGLVLVGVAIKGVFDFLQETLV
ncbi:MAG TPA: hypothetical protein PLX97_09250, partial [Gemmatales bacterium]|nr:hypothetical protein [Gemmatales bacterium]